MEVRPAPIEDIYPLAPLQQGLLFHEMYSPRSGAYFVQANCRLLGGLDRDAFIAAWRNATARHAILRTAFVTDLAEPLQIVYETVEAEIVLEDWRTTPAERRAARLETWLEEDLVRGFNVVVPPLFRLALLAMDERYDHFVFSIHHVLLDGWSLRHLIGEVFAEYATLAACLPSELPSVRPYRDFIAWLQTRDVDAAKAFWRAALAGMNSPALLCTAVKHSSRQLETQRQTYRTHSFRLTRELTTSLQQLARASEVTMNALMLAAWLIVLQRYTGRRDVCCGVIAATRPSELPGSERMQGLLVNTLPLACAVDSDSPCVEWLARVQSTLLAIRQFDYLPLHEVRACAPIPSGQPLFDTCFAYQSFDADVPSTVASGNVRVAEWRVREQTSYPLTITIYPSAECRIGILHDSSQLSATLVDALSTHLTRLWEQMVARPAGRLADYSLLTMAEAARGVASAPSRESRRRLSSVHEAFALQSSLHPDHVALVCADECMTYAELEERADRLARRLVARGTPQESVVAVCAERSIDAIVAMLAVLKAGAAYLPVDPAYPPERLNFIVRDAKVHALLHRHCDRKCLQGLDAGVACISIDEEVEAADEGRVELPFVPPEALAYVLYTSGSTGVPKGVAVTHASALNLCIDNTYVRLDAASVVLSAAPIVFDAATFEIWCTLLNGARVVLLPEKILSPESIAESRKRHGAAIVFLTTTLFNNIVDLAVNSLEGFEHVLVGGESASAQHVAKALGALERIRVSNVYGPTECTTFSCEFALGHGACREVEDPVPIGRAIAGVELYIVDESLNVVPDGVAGELCIGGQAVARGYLNRPSLTATRFIANPFAAGGRLYRTGDVVRCREDGILEFLGRRDDQVKIRGFRIEPGEIEATLLAHAGVRQAAVVASRAAPGTERRLSAFIVAEEGVTLVESEVWRFLERSLPDYMVPASLAVLASLPLTMTGKVDRQQLLGVMPSTRQRSAYVAPRGEVEEAVARIFQQSLGVERVGAFEDFFALGGHSLAALRMVALLRDHFAADFTVKAIFDAPTVREMAELVTASRKPSPAGDVRRRADLTALVDAMSNDEVATLLRRLRGDAP